MRFTPCALAAAIGESPVLAAFTKGRSPTHPSSGRGVPRPSTASRQASARSNGIPIARAKSFAVPTGTTASGTPARAAASAAKPIEPSPPATALRAGVPGGYCAPPMIYDKDANLAALEGRTVAILGYGSQGHAHALNLRDSGVDVVVGLREGSASVDKARGDGLRVESLADAASEGDLVMVLLPDEKQAEVWESEIS